MRIGVLIAAALAIAAVQAGVLVIDTTLGNGTIITATWLQGAEKADVRFADGSIYRENMTLISGPNRCFIYGADGNDRAIVIEPQSDDTGPARDATVDCRVCGCEDEPGTRYTCTRSGACAACDPCESNACNSGELCVRETCETYRCACDPIQCSGTVCEDRLTVTSACASDRCEQTKTCIEGRCGAQCTSGSRSVELVCDSSVLYRETTQCTNACESASERERVTDCAQRSCPAGEEPVCSDGGCRCR